MKRKRILAIGDLHLPFLHKGAFGSLLKIIPILKPDIVIQMGDMFDLFSFSKFPSRIIMTPQDEVDNALILKEHFWMSIKKVASNAKLMAIKGNHDVRGAKRMIEAVPHLLALYEEKDIWSYPGVTVVKDSREELIIDDIVFIHGRTRNGEHLRHNDFKNTVVGHTHLGSVHYHRMHTGEIRWELNAGYLGDPFCEALTYRPQSKFFRWTHGCGFIDEHGPRFIPL